MVDNRNAVALLVRGRSATQADGYTSALGDAPLRWPHEPHTPLVNGQFDRTLGGQYYRKYSIKAATLMRGL